MDPDTILLYVALVFGFYMAWNIGANDVGNSMGTSVGSRALTLRQAVVLAAIANFAGAVLVGGKVTDTVRKGITDPMIYVDNPETLLYGMLAALLAAGFWLQIATSFGWPVSTTHSIIGAVVGFGVVAGGVDSIDWVKVASIASSWVISPLLSGIVAFIAFSLIRKLILNAKDIMLATKRIVPIIFGLVVLVMSLVLLFKGLKHLNLDMTLEESVLISGLLGFGAWAVSGLFLHGVDFNRYKRKFVLNQQRAVDDNLMVSQNLRKSLVYKDKNLGYASGSIHNRLDVLYEEMEQIADDIEDNAYTEAKNQGREDYHFVERIFGYLQVLSAVFVAFAHGANDVANAIGPLAAVVSIIQTKQVLMQVGVPFWLLLLGGVGIAIGIGTLGWKVMETIGKKITEITPSRGFAAEFSAATVIAIASKMGIPISTTHTLVGAVIGVGMARGISSINLNVVRNIVVSWFVTVPAGAIFAIIFYYILKAIFGT